MSLYRTYRPKTFAEVIGQDHIVTTLEHAVERDDIAHAYLFAGSRGTGKTSVARILARHLLLRGEERETVKEYIRQGTEDGSIVDLLEIDAASNRGIDDIRNLIEKVHFPPVLGRAKVYIIDEAHMLTKEACNALLKTLEEPPLYAYFILATTELWKIPATIQSRCLRFGFRPLREEDIVRQLQCIADHERITIERTALRAIANHAQGSMRDAIALLEQLRSLEHITLADTEERIGKSGKEHVETIFAAMEKHDAKEVALTIHKLEEHGIPLEQFLRECLTAARIHLRHALEEDADPTALLHLLDLLLQTLRELRWAPVPAITIEAAFLSFCTEKREEGAGKPSIIFRKKEEEHGQGSESQGQEKEEQKQETKNKKEETEERTDIAAKILTRESLQAEWPHLLPRVSPPATRMSLKNGHIASCEGQTVTLSFPSAFHRDRVAETSAARHIEDVITSVFKTPIRLRCILEEQRTPHHPADTEVVDLAQAAAEVF